MKRSAPLLVGTEGSKSSRPHDPVVAEVLHRLAPQGSLSLCRSSRLALVLRWRCHKTGAPLITAGQLRAARTNKKLGRDAGDSESLTFAQALSARTGMHRKRAERLIAFGALGASRLRRLEHTPDDRQRALQALLGLDEAYRDGKPTPAEPVAADWWEGVPGFEKTETLFRLPGVVTLHLGDSEVVLKEYADETFDGSCSDQPYGVNYASSNGVRIAGDGKVKDTSGWLVPALQRKLKRDAYAILHGQEAVTHAWEVEMMPGGFRKADDLVWDKVIASVRGSTVRRRHESIYIFAKGHPRRPNHWVDHWGLTGAEPGTKVTKGDSIWRHTKPTDSSHPTGKPPDLHQREMLTYFPVSALLLDPCMGTGPVAVAALRSGHRLVGVELVSHYYRIAVERVEAELRRPEVAAAWINILDARSGG